MTFISFCSIVEFFSRYRCDSISVTYSSVKSNSVYKSASSGWGVYSRIIGRIPCCQSRKYSNQFNQFTHWSSTRKENGNGKPTRKNTKSSPSQVSYIYNRFRIGNNGNKTFFQDFCLKWEIWKVKKWRYYEDNLTQSSPIWNKPKEGFEITVIMLLFLIILLPMTFQP